MARQNTTNTPPIGPIAQKLTHIQSNGHQVPPSSRQSVGNQSPKRVDMSKVRDWLNVLGTLLISLMIGVYTIAYNGQQSKISQQQYDNSVKIADASRKADVALQTDQQRETALASYIQNMKDLISTEGLQTSKPGDEVRVIARAQTLITLRQLDGIRKGIVMQFLSEAKLINNAGIGTIKDVIIDLTGANLAGADLVSYNLRGAHLNDADLTGAHLVNADLTGADLRIARLSGADLINANLINANLFGADLSDANLTDADLTGANLFSANLNHANLYEVKVTKEQLDKIYSLYHAGMPDGSIHP